MYCHHPLEIHLAPGLTEAGKRRYVFDLRDSLDPDRLIPHQHIQIPCGQCLACRVRRAQEWAARLWLEWKTTPAASCFLTLTYAPEHVPADMSLRKEDYQLFLKRLRKRLDPVKIRYYVAGEYGADFARPHYHFLIFGYDFADSRVPFANVFNRTDCKEYISPFVSELWPYGYHKISPLSDACICYVCKYVIKKLTGPRLAEYNGRLPEFGIGSKGIARDWYGRYGSEIWSSGYFVWGDRFARCRPVRYFEKILAKCSESDLQLFKERSILKHLHDRKEVFDHEYRLSLRRDEEKMYHDYALYAHKRHTQI